jgi:hypothetical protein
MGLNLAAVASHPVRASSGANAVLRKMSGKNTTHALWVAWGLPVFRATKNPIAE